MKRLKKTVHSKNTTRKKNNGGMTYIELLVALSLLVLVVTVFSPMLLSSYDSLYKAGERTSEAYNARFDIENRLATRENDQILTVGTNFKTNAATLGNTIKITARRISSSFSGLETLYSGGKGVIKIVSDTLVKDNQSSHTVRIKLTNLAFDNYVIIKSASEFEQIKNDPTKLEGKVAFYITSIFDSATPLNGTVVNRPNFSSGDAYFPYVDILIEDVDITYSPIQFSAYYINDFGSMKVANTYLTITEADMIFVGKTTSDSDYFTLSDATINNHPAVAGRVMYTAPIADGKVLTDVTFNQATNSLTEGFYAMCGENGITRRLWHLDATRLAQVKELDDTAVNEADTSKVSEPEIIYKSMSLGGATPYFQYDWAGDMTDLMAYTSKSSSSATLDYESSDSDTDLKDGNYIWVNEYNVDNTYFAYNFDGFNSGHGKFRDNHRRISYTLESSQAEWEKATNKKVTDGIILRKGQLDNKDKEEVNVGNDSYNNGENKSYLYCPSCKSWFNVWYEWDWGWDWIKNKAPMTGVSLATGWGKNQNAQFSDGKFSIRHCTAEDNGWASNEYAEIESGESRLASINIKSYNTLTPQAIATPNKEAKSNTSSAKVNFTSCAVLPGNGAKTLYLGTVDSSTLINQTEGYIGADTKKYDIDDGHCGTYVYITENGKTYKKYYRQMTPSGMKSSLGTGDVAVGPDPNYGYNSYINEQGYNKYTSWEQVDVQFTLGYCSDLYKMFKDLESRDMKPLEEIYSYTMGVKDVANDHDSDFRKNLWFPREFLNITQSDGYNNSMVAVGYDVGGYSKMLEELAPEWTTSTDTKYLSGTGDMDANDNGIVDFVEYDSLTTSTTVNLNGTNYSLLVNVGANCGSCSGKLHVIDPCPGQSAKKNHSQTFIALPQHAVVSTVVDKVLNNGVISVYNAGDATFTNIGYYKAPNKTNVRFNCVSVDMLKPAVDADGVGDASSGVLGAAIGGSDGRVYLGLLAYAGGMIGKTPLVWGSTLLQIADYTEKFTSIESVKAFRNGDDFCILVGGRSKSKGADTVISLITIKDGNVASVEHNVQTLVKGSAYDITDFIIADGKIYLTAQDYDGKKGRVGICPLTTNGVINISGDNWKFIDDYYTEFTTDKASGGISVSGSKKTLPPLKALASTLPAE